MKTIYDFKNGDEIVRILPAKPYAPLMASGDGLRDRSYLGKKLIFIGIANGQIYLKRTESSDLAIFGDSFLSLSLDIWDEGWDFYINPESLIGDSFTSIDKKTLEEQIKKAVADENYELAQLLTSKLNKK